MAYGKNRLQALTRSISPGTPVPAAAGEEAGHYQKRNEKLIARYYYYSFIKKKRSNDVLMALSEDFNISTRRICTVLEENSTAIHELRKKAPTIADFRKQFPSLTW